ncbi:piezo-type mechanosensitive ion channel component 1-like, partial [Egretta garzetta]|uniref:piezo-type mechanosensitive ion channel component 1-like n=1 Tax=Egretta garzetta TaxID=188379 RepID=UPI00163B84E6
MKQSYVCALIAMMVWSITYHSWLTFVLLLWACLIWTVRSRHHFAMLCSPFLLLYGVALCSLQYVWGMDLAPELPTRVGFMSLEQLGLVHPKYPCLDLGAKLLLTLTFWLLLREFVKEKLLTRSSPATPLLEVTIADTGEGSRCHPPGGTLRRGVSLMNFLLVLLWAFAMPYCRFRHMASCLSTVWTCIIIVCKMLYQLKIVDPNEYSSNCTQPQLNSTNLSPEELGNSTLYRGPVDPANWFGIRKGYPNLGYIQ